MKKQFKNIIKILALVIFIMLPNKAFAEEIYSIDINVDIDKDGIGHVTEVWHTNEDNKDATEKFKAFTDLGEIDIRDFRASLNGEDFSEKEPWDLDASFEEKAHRYGVVYNGDRVELCWGITEFGENTYTLNYVIDPLVVSLNDYDMVNFRFIKENLEPRPDKITIKINGYEPFDENVSMWAFGFIGDVHNVDGSILAQSSGEVDYGQVILRLPKGMFNSNYTINHDFMYYEEQAIEGSDFEIAEDDSYYEDDYNSPGILGIIADTFVPIFIVLFASFGGLATAFGVGNKYKIHNKKLLKKERKFDEQYYRDIPYDGPIEDTYFLSGQAFSDSSYENYMNAFLLKWIYEGAISFENDEVKSFIGSKKSSYIKINDTPSNMSEIEKGFFNIIRNSERYTDDEKIRQKHIEKFMKDNETFMENYFEDFTDHSIDQLVEHGYLNNDKTPRKFVVNGEAYKNHISVTDKGVSLYENLIKFKNYLKDYSLIEEREVNEVKLWDQFMIYAAIYGISKEVYKNFTAVYPEYENYSMFDYYMITGLNNYSSGIARAANNSLDNFEAAGSGGASSFGGGGGGFGGGSGGSGGGSR